jgi:phosphopantetheinyl transferase
VRCDALGDAVPSVALAHSRGVVLAAAGPPGTRVGIDVERADPAGRPRDVLGAFTPTEQRLAMSSLGAVGALWCAKEAAAKASGLGLEGNPRRWPVVAYRPDEGTAVVTHEGERYPVRVLAGPEETIAMCGPLMREHDSGAPQGAPETTEVTA